MKYILILPLFLLYSCSDSEKKFKYKIVGKKDATVRTGDFFTGYKSKKIEADVVAYTDTLHGLNSDSVWFFNSDGSITSISSPYEISELK